MVSSKGAVTYGVAKELPNILRQLVANPLHHMQNMQDFVKQIKNIRVGEGECIPFYDVKALFTSVPVDPAITITKNKLKQDSDLHKGTSISINYIITPLEFSLKNTYFMYQGTYYEMVHGAAIGSPISPILTILFKEEFEPKAIKTAINIQDCWEDMLMTPCHWKGRTKDPISETHEFYWPSHPGYYRRVQNRWINALFGHTGHTRIRQLLLATVNKRLRTLNSTSIGTSITTYLQNTVCTTPSHTEQRLFVQTLCYYKKRMNRSRGSSKVQISWLGAQLAQNEKQSQVQHQQPTSKQQGQQNLHDSTLHQKIKWKFQQHLSETGNTSPLQRRWHNQGPPVTPKDRDTIIQKSKVVYWY